MSIDVMLPYYGDVEHFKKAVESVLVQSYTDFRLIVVDDGFPDPEPARYMGELTAADSRVTYEQNEVNLGANGNYRKCLGMVEAQTVVVMGADDIMLPNYLQAVHDGFAAQPDAAVFECGVAVIDENGAGAHSLADVVKAWQSPVSGADGRKVLGGEELMVSLMRGNWTYFPSLAWNAEWIKRIGFREGLDVVQDLALLVDTVSAGGTIVIDPALAFLYRRHSASDSSVRALDGRRFAEESRFFAGEAKAFSERGWNKAARAARGHVTSRLNAATLLPTALKAGKLREGGPTLLRHIFR
ncbi:glycosyltransferase family 2 protein [Dietzia sp.]|uniref:glycosyltransferase family 2 protein n=1 Tax=Dietzia sp. TaxID=1871616 RepID=UPI002FDAA652